MLFNADKISLRSNIENGDIVALRFLFLSAVLTDDRKLPRLQRTLNCPWRYALG